MPSDRDSGLRGSERAEGELVGYGYLPKDSLAGCWIFGDIVKSELRWEKDHRLVLQE